jgi:hypothetical protein
LVGIWFVVVVVVVVSLELVPDGYAALKLDMVLVLDLNQMKRKMK